jgi:hypothetical protein
MSVAFGGSDKEAGPNENIACSKKLKAISSKYAYFLLATNTNFSFLHVHIS